MTYLTVLSLGMIMLIMLVDTYRTAIDTHEVQSQTTLRVDYDMKEEAVLREMVPVLANRAMQAMQNGSGASTAISEPLTWQKIFRASILGANAETSVSSAALRNFSLQNAIVGNTGDATTWASETFRAIDRSDRYTTPGLNQDYGAGFPPPLEATSSTVKNKDFDFPIISSLKYYGSLAESRVGADVATYPQYNLIPYPNIRFGYAKPGQNFVAKRNWWGFRMNLADHQKNVTGNEKRARDFIVSIYEVPSQLAISAEAFTVLGEYADGSQWQNATIQGGVFSSRARVGAGMGLEWISGRNGLEISADAQIGDNPLIQDGDTSAIETGSDGTSLAVNPFAPGVRERYELLQGDYMPVSLASESGRAAFVPINRGADFFDRFAHSAETNTVSPTTWNNYSVGALQCAMSLDISDVPDVDDPSPSELTFRYLKNGTKQTMVIDLEQGDDTGLPSGYIKCCVENQTVFFGEPVDVAYGKNGSYYFQSGVSGSVTFNNARFGDPLVGVVKNGYYRPSFPFEVTILHDTKQCLTVYPERFKSFLAQIGGDAPDKNNSLCINVDYPGSAYLQKPTIPCTDLDYGVIVRECADLTDFTKGFSMVTNLRLYIADDFNTTAMTPPAGSGLPSPFYPPCSLFAPEKRYGAEVDPFKLNISGQLGSLAGGGTGGSEVHLLDLKTSSNADVAHDDVVVNLAAIAHPAALPPITMMNWLIVIEERHRALYEGTAASN